MKEIKLTLRLISKIPREMSETLLKKKVNKEKKKYYRDTIKLKKQTKSLTYLHYIHLDDLFQNLSSILKLLEVFLK